MNETLIVSGFFGASLGIGFAAFIFSALRELFASKKPPQKRVFETDHPVVIIVERLGKFVTIFFYTLWTWLILSNFEDAESPQFQTYLRIGLLCLHLVIASYMMLRSVLAVAATASNAEFVHAIGAKNSKWERLEDRLLFAALGAASVGTLFGIYFLVTNQA